ncbi:MAG: twin-arginine translocase TatA/TatE family subunit [Chloroflexi bacterium]|nr:twin-arginine translocase TatA/TatE family subunit [Chloroflexota bacterium]
MQFLRNIGPLEWFLILVIVIILFGPNRLAELGGALGKSIREFQKALKGEEAGPNAKEPPESEVKKD